MGQSLGCFHPLAELCLSNKPVSIPELWKVTFFLKKLLPSDSRAIVAQRFLELLYRNAILLVDRGSSNLSTTSFVAGMNKYCKHCNSHQ